MPTAIASWMLHLPRECLSVSLGIKGSSGIGLKYSARTIMRMPPDNSGDFTESRRLDFDSLAALEAGIAFDTESLVGDIDQDALDLVAVLGDNRASLGGF